jgi:2-keto-3-deoxy-L-rhamnonate aldolase RhmA
LPDDITHISRSRIQIILDQGRIPLGIQCFSGSPPLIEIAGYAGFDFVMIDTEHANVDAVQLEHLVRAADAAGIEPLVRVAANDPTLIRHALEAGARGIIVPQVRTSADVAAAVSAAKYPPDGTRGMCPATRAARYSVEGWDQYARASNDNVLIIPILEHPDAITNADEICALPQVNAILFGSADLGMALGAGGQGMGHPDVAAAFERVLEVAARHDTAVMAVPFPDLSAEACEQLVSSGVSILLHSVDELLFAQICRGIVSDLRPLLNADSARLAHRALDRHLAVKGSG